MYDFDKLVDRRGTASVKWDVRDLFGVGPEAELTPTVLISMAVFVVLLAVYTILRARKVKPVEKV